MATADHTAGNRAEHYDVIVIGAGPGGCATALSLAQTGLSIAIIDKGNFPRDKICGDALSPDVLAQLRKLNGDLEEKFIERYEPRKTEVCGVRLRAANGKEAILRIDRNRTQQLSGWVAKRIDFDNFLFEEVCGLPNVSVFQGESVKGVSVSADQVDVKTTQRSFSGEIVVGADGAHSIVAKTLAPVKLNREHYCGGVRAYYRNVEGMHPDGMIELHYYKKLLPGYLWIFPLPNGEANVGLGMLSSHISKNKVNLRTSLLDHIANEPALQKRFSNAELIDSVRGFGLPLGSKKRPLSGERFMLIGDAAALIDPVTGEGVGNAIRSGRMAAEQIVKCFENRDFTASTMLAYDKRIYGLVWNEMRFSRFMQLSFRYPAVINFFTSLAANSSRFNRFLDNAITDAEFWGDAFSFKRWARHWKRAGDTSGDA